MRIDSRLFGRDSDFCGKRTVRGLEWRDANALRLRTREEISYTFSISSSGHLGPLLNREILDVEGHYASGFAQSSRPNLTQI